MSEKKNESATSNEASTAATESTSSTQATEASTSAGTPPAPAPAPAAPKRHAWSEPVSPPSKKAATRLDSRLPDSSSRDDSGGDDE